MHMPNIVSYIDDSKSYTLIPVFTEVPADFETPISILLKVGGKFLLESVERGENVGRFSIIGLGMMSMIRITERCLSITEFENGEAISEEEYKLDNPLLKVREYFQKFRTPVYPGLPPFFGGAIGYLGYEAVQYIEKIPVHRNNGSTPDAMLVIPEVLLVYDTVKRSVFIIASTVPGDNPEKGYRQAAERIDDVTRRLAVPLAPQVSPVRPGITRGFQPNMRREDFIDCVKRCKEYIRSGDIIQVVISQKFKVETDASPFDLYRSLRIINPSPYMFFLDFDDLTFIGSSPEVMVRVQNGELMLKPIAGTRRRGGTLEEDGAIAHELLADEKERAEHLMLVDLGRNDLGRVAVPGSVDVTDFMTVEKYSHVMHIVSTIKASLDKRFDVFDVISATFPAGTLTGAPKIRAMEIISEMEPERRGPYGGMVFYLCFNGNMDSCITIRTIVIEDGVATVQAGAGIVADSIPKSEYDETINKARALMSAVENNIEGVKYGAADR